MGREQGDGVDRWCAGGGEKQGGSGAVCPMMVASAPDGGGAGVKPCYLSVISDISDVRCQRCQTKSAGLGRRREHKICEIGKNQPKSTDRGGRAALRAEFLQTQVTF